ncbi:MAG: exodeoxyribonuclease VII small subunit [Desulfobulbaceae bacterium A2]|nr:MAG: exodeoxyribonuclease VII small subunit [Desulfobulbaceae bacterium A2]
MSKKNFEHALARLEQITQELDDADLGLEASLKKFEEGVQLVNFCHTRLEEARGKVALLLQQDGTLTAVDFPEHEHDDDHELS